MLYDFKNLSRVVIEGISENEMPGAMEEIPKEESYIKYGDTAREVEIGAIGKHGAFLQIHASGIPGGESLIEGRFS